MKARRWAVHKSGPIPLRSAPLRLAVHEGAEGGKAEVGAVARAKDALAVRTMEVSASRRGLTPRGSLECNPEIPVAPGEEPDLGQTHPCTPPLPWPQISWLPPQTHRAAS